MIRVKQLQRIHTDNIVTGVAQLRDRIFVICSAQKITLHVYDAKHCLLVDDDVRPTVTLIPQDQEQGQEQGQESVRCATDIAACSIQQCLYVPDVNYHSLLQITGDGRSMVEWMHTENVVSIFW